MDIQTHSPSKSAHVMENQSSQKVGEFFNSHWATYKEAVNQDFLFHRTMFSLLNDFIKQHWPRQAFSMIDLGCGDSSATLSVIADKNISEYIGIDSAKDILKVAEQNLQGLNCHKQWIAKDMSSGIAAVDHPVDLIFSSYAIHHLSATEKTQLFALCYEKLKPEGYMVLVDGVKAKGQSRENWIEFLANRYKEMNPHLTPQQLQEWLIHPEENDQPEEIDFFETLAKQQHWSEFEIVLNKRFCAFMVFKK